MLARTPTTPCLLLPNDRSEAEVRAFRTTKFLQPVFRRHWKAPKNGMGGFKSYEDMKAEMAAERAAYYGPPQGPCNQPNQIASFHGYHTPTCNCGWTMGAHQTGRAV